MSATTTPKVGELWLDNDRRAWMRIPVRIVAVDTTHATVDHELDGEKLPGRRRIHLSHFSRPGGYQRATTIRSTAQAGDQK